MTRPKVLITGAGGFIGGWMTEALHLAGYDVRAGVGRWASAARIARLPVEIVRCDILDEASLDESLAGVDVVVNCARAKDDAQSLVGARLLLSRAAAGGVKQVIHLSSAAIYGDALGVVTEDTAPVGPLSPYAAGKRDVEQVFAAEAKPGLKVAILRPTLVYGPFSDTWTVPYIPRLLSGQWKTLGPAGEGRANLIYVGDLVRFVEFLIKEQKAALEIYNANGVEIPTWNEYFVRFAKALGVAPPVPAGGGEVALQSALRRPVRELGKLVLANHRDLVLAAMDRFLPLHDLLKSLGSDLKQQPNPDELRLYGMDVVYSMDKARNAGFVPATSLDDGLAACAEWARDMGLAA